MFDVGHIFESNSVITSIDILHLVRSLQNVPRSHTLPLIKRESILEHQIKCVHLLDFLNHQDFFNPIISKEDLYDIKNYLLYHDIHEVLTGDSPYYVEKYLGNAPSELRNYLTNSFVDSINLKPELFKIAKFVDALDFLLVVTTDPLLDARTFDGQRIRKAVGNAKSIIQKYMSDSDMKYKIKSIAVEALVNEYKERE